MQENAAVYRTQETLAEGKRLIDITVKSFRLTSTSTACRATINHIAFRSKHLTALLCYTLLRNIPETWRPPTDRSYGTLTLSRLSNSEICSETQQPQCTQLKPERSPEVTPTYHSTICLPVTAILSELWKATQLNHLTISLNRRTCKGRFLWETRWWVDEALPGTLQHGRGNNHYIIQVHSFTYRRIDTIIQCSNTIRGI